MDIWKRVGGRGWRAERAKFAVLLAAPVCAVLLYAQPAVHEAALTRLRYVLYAPPEADALTALMRGVEAQRAARAAAAARGASAAAAAAEPPAGGGGGSDGRGGGASGGAGGGARSVGGGSDRVGGSDVGGGAGGVGGGGGRGTTRG